MIYSLRKTGRMIWLHKGMYLLLLIEVAIGMFLFSYCLNTTMSCDDTVRSIDAGIGTDAIQLACYLSGMNYQPDGFPVEPGFVEQLRQQERAEGLGIQYLPYVQGTIYFADTGESAEIYLLFADEESGIRLGFQTMQEEGYIGSRAAEHLRRLVFSEPGEPSAFGYSSLVLSEKALVFGDEWECLLDQLLPMQEEMEAHVISRSYSSISADDQILLSDCIVLPLERMGALAHAEGLNGKVSLQFFLEGWNGDFRIFADIVKELNATNADYHFSLTQQSVELHEGAEDLMIPYRTSLWVGISVLAISTSGMVGAFILILHRREKTNAVAVACGATYGKLFAELFAEVGSVIFVGTLIGLLCSVPAVLRVRLRAISMMGAMHAEAVLGCLGISVLATVLICGGATLLVRGRQLAEVLKAS